MTTNDQFELFSEKSSMKTCVWHIGMWKEGEKEKLEEERWGLEQRSSSNSGK